MFAFTRFLSCPLCGTHFTSTDRSVRCATGHSFDVSRHGYLSLLPGRRSTLAADTAAMVDARGRFLSEGHYAPLARRLAYHVAHTNGALSDGGGCLLEVGAGTGYYLASALEACPRAQGIALDLSKYAGRSAARAHPRMGAVVADATARLPLRSGAVTAALSVFSPRNGSELHRVLSPGGRLFVVTPTERHLRELVERLGLLKVDPSKRQRLEARLGAWFEFAHDEELDLALRLPRTSVQALVEMGPSAFHLDLGELAWRIGSFEALTAVTASFRIHTLLPR